MSTKGILTLIILATLNLSAWAQNPTEQDHDIVVFELLDFKGKLQLASPTLIAGRPGYDNQPKFGNDSETVFFTRIENGDSDIWSWTIDEGELRWAATKWSEYSACLHPTNKKLITAVRVEEDGNQRLWSYSPLQGFRLVFEQIHPVGYYAWSGQNIAMFVLGPPHDLRVTRLGRESTDKVDSNVGRCIQTRPGTSAISYTVHGDEKSLRIKTYDFKTQEISEHRLLPPKTEDYDWLDSDTILTSDGKSILIGKIDENWPWEEIRNLSDFEMSGITRLAISPDGKKLAVVYIKAKP